MNFKILNRKLCLFKSLNEEIEKVPAKTYHDITLADQYDLRFMDKQELKGISHDAQVSILKYANGYVKEFEDSNFLYDKYGMADFEESETYWKIKGLTKLIETELTR
jgi:hypothetical protein